jgi:hypothetical protein
MLRKLLKQDFKAIARLLLPIYLLIAVLTIMDRIVLQLRFRGSLSIITGFVSAAYVISLIAIIIVTNVIVILRFYKNLMTDEGYLMFTLPVKQSELIISKLIVSFVWNITSVLAILLSLFLVFVTPERMSKFCSEWASGWHYFQKVFGKGNSTLFLIEILILLIIGILQAILMIYASIAIGQLFNSHRVLGSFVAYIAITTLLQIISTVGTSILGMNFFQPYNFDDIAAIPRVIFPTIIAFLAVTAVGFYLLTNYLFKKKLNLE